MPAKPINLDAQGTATGREVALGAAFTAASQIVRIAVQIASVSILARLLTPNDFGLVAMAGPILSFVLLFSDLGLTQATIQRKDLSQQQASALFWINTLAGFLLFVILVIASPIAGSFYGNPAVTYIVCVLGVSLCLNGATAQHIALLNRMMRFRALAAIEATGAVLSLITTVLFALAGAKYWSIVAGSVAMSLFNAIGAWATMRWLPDRPSAFRDIRSLMSFGANVTGFNLANFFSRNLDNVLIGHRWGPLQLGLYDRAYKLLLLPLQQVTGPISRVMIPTLSRLLGRDDEYREMFQDVMTKMIFLTVPGVLILLSFTSAVIDILLGHKWSNVTPIFLALGYSGLVQPLNNPTGWLFITQARTREYAAWGLASATCNIAAFFIGLPHGAIGVALAYTASEILRTPVLWWLVTRRGPVTWKFPLKLSMPYFILAPLSIFVIGPATRLVAPNNLAQLALGVPLTYLAALACIFIFPSSRTIGLNTFRQIRDLLSKRLTPNTI